MSVSATFEGAYVEILDVVPNGCDIYVLYKDSSNNIKIGKTLISRSSSSTIIATSATVS